MLTGTMTTHTAELWAESGNDSEHIDSTNLSSAALIVAEAAEGLVASRGRDDWITLMHALAELTRFHADKGDPQPLFSVAVLREQCAARDPANKVYWLSEEDTGRKKFSKAWEKLEASFPGLEGNLRQRAEKRRIPGRAIAYTTSDDQDKRIKLYGLRLISIRLPESPKLSPLASSEASNLPASEDLIEYVEEMEIYPIPGIRHPVLINVQGWRSLFMVAPVMIFIISGACGSWLLLQAWLSEFPIRIIFQGSLTIVIFVSVLAWLALPFYRLIDQRIIMAPSILQMTSPFVHVLVIRKENEVKVIRMVRVTATCPLCGGLVEIQEGRRQYRGRFVGACERNPIEHLFSFDHVRRRGTALRSNN